MVERLELRDSALQTATHAHVWNRVATTFDACTRHMRRSLHLANELACHQRGAFRIDSCAGSFSGWHLCRHSRLAGLLTVEVAIGFVAPELFTRTRFAQL